jgi:hypothetical protein
VDFKKVFDIVLREMLWQVLAGLGVEGRFLRCLHAMYAKDIVCINHPSKGVTFNFRSQQGVKQGWLLSPLLFGLYLDALEGRLDGKECDAPSRCARMAAIFCGRPRFYVRIRSGTIATIRYIPTILC